MRNELERLDSQWSRAVRDAERLGKEAEGLASELSARTAELMEQTQALEMQKDDAYHERDLLVAALSKLFPAHLCRHPDSDKEWDDQWRWIVCIHLPTGQACWHIIDWELSHFGHLQRLDNHWDGHTSEEKYIRLGELSSTAAELNKAGHCRFSPDPQIPEYCKCGYHRAAHIETAI